MGIGILTFHWATNYGAILQTLALQKYLLSKGYSVYVINYKPDNYDFNLKNFLLDKEYLHICEYLKKRKKERTLEIFRLKYLNLTERVKTFNDISQVVNELDVIISGSDQVLNASFLHDGEGRGTITPSYYLGFPYHGRKIGYATSFGVVTYPSDSLEIAADYIHDFYMISVREKTGIDIVRQMGREDAFVVPDPTILLESKQYELLSSSFDEYISLNYFCYFIRNINNRKERFKKLALKGFTIWNNHTNNYTLEGWLSNIKRAELVITDSFHCVVMCLKLHTEFVVVTELLGKLGMNDRLYTLLSPLKLEQRIVHKDCFSDIVSVIKTPIEWRIVDEQLDKLKLEGEIFLKKALCYD